MLNNSRIRVRVSLVGLLGWFCLGGTGDVWAQDGAVRPSSARARLVLDDFAVVGKIQKPQVQFLISRERGVSQEAIELKESFLSKVVEAVEEEPF